MGFNEKISKFFTSASFGNAPTIDGLNAKKKNIAFVVLILIVSLLPLFLSPFPGGKPGWRH